MPLSPITATDALASLEAFSAVIDARSEAEYALDRIPGAVNWPSLNDAERALVVVGDRQDGVVMQEHLARHLTDGVRGATRDGVRSHDVGDGDVLGLLVLRAHPEREVALGDHADEAALGVADGQEADAVLAHEAGGEQHVFLRTDRPRRGAHDLHALHR